MDSDLFLQNLRDLPLGDGKAYIQEHIDELADHAVIGNLLADEALRLLYSPFVSLKLAELLIFFGDYVQHISSHALGLKAKGDALVQIGHFQAAMESLDGAGGEFLSLNDEGNWARSRISWITACASLGRVEKALQQATRARDVFLQIGEYSWACNIVDNTAVIYAQTGRYQDAIDLYEGMLAIYSATIDQNEDIIQRAIAIGKLNQAEILSWLGKFEEAYRLFQLASESFIALGETSLVTYSETHLAELDYIQGYYGSALRRYYLAHDSAVQNNVDNPLWLSELKFCTANCLVKLNRSQEACQLMDDAIEVYRQLGTSLQTCMALSTYATALIASRRIPESLAALNEASNLFDQGGFHEYAFNTKLRRAELLLEMGSLPEAYEEANLVKKHFIEQGFVERIVRASLVMANALIEIAQQAADWNRAEQQSIYLQEAIRLCKVSTRAARRHNLQIQVYESQYLLGRINLMQGDLVKAAKHFRAAIDQIELILGNLVFDLSPSFLHTTWTIYEDMIALCLQRGLAKQAFNYLERARSMALHAYLNKSKEKKVERKEREISGSESILHEKIAAMLRTQQELRNWQQQYHDYSVLLSDIDTSVSPAVDQNIIQIELKRCETRISELFERLRLYESEILTKTRISCSETRVDAEKATRNVQQVNIAQLRQHLLTDQLLLTYYLYKSRLVIFAITTGCLVTYENPNGAEQLEYLLPLRHAHLQPSGWPDPNHPPQQVIRRLLNKLYDLLIAPIVSILPSSSGYLTIVPYGPLHKLPFHALFDGSQFLIENFKINYLPASNMLTHLCNHKSEDTLDSVGTDIPTASPLVLGYSKKGHLQRALDEARTLATMLDGRSYLEEEATIKRLFEQAHGSPVIHIATHGQSRLDAPNFSFVRLADGQLNAIDAFNLDLNSCELVTLSGCETGLALNGGGDEQLGLGRAFLAAGASSLVMSLWSVEDKATSDLMQLFYQNLMRGDSKAQALQNAQCGLLQQSSSYTHPYFWAAFRLVGEVGPLKYQRANLSSSSLEIYPQKSKT
jgi:CHAT domain-containing protein